MRLQWTGVMAAAVITCGGAAFGADYQIDPIHSFALFKVKHMGASYAYGEFTDVGGTLSFDAAKPEASKVEVSIKAESVFTHNEARDKHVRGPDFLNTKEFPSMTFKSTAWKKTGENMFDVSGELTIAGKTKTITVPVEHVGDGKDPRGRSLSGFHTVFTIDRSEFGMKYGLPDALGKDVQITLGVEGFKK